MYDHVCFDSHTNNAISLVSGQMSHPAPDTINTLLRQPSTTSSDQEPAASSASQPIEEDNILEEIEAEEAKKAKAARSRKKESGVEDGTMVELKETMRQHRELLEMLLVPANSEREACIRWIGDTLRNAPPSVFRQLRDRILNVITWTLSQAGVAAGDPGTGASSSDVPDPTQRLPQPQRTPQRPSQQLQQQHQQQQQQQQQHQQQQQPGPSGYQPPSFPSPNMFASPPFPWGMDYQMSPNKQRRNPRESSEFLGRVLATNYSGEDWFDNPTDSRTPTKP